MPPGGGGGGHGCAVQDHLPATHPRDEDALPHSTPPLCTVVSEEKKQEQPPASLPEGPLVEILARVPYSSLCRFKSVSKPWLALCSSGDIRRRSPQTLSGFFFYKDAGDLHFRNLSGRGPPLVDPSLSFLRESYKHISVEQFGGGLLLCRCWNTGTESDYLVCNPATEEWTVLPPLALAAQDFSNILHFKPIAYLGFDAAVPSCFVVFAPLSNGLNDSRKVAIYSSRTGRWTYVQSRWVAGTLLDHTRQTRVFLNGTIHLITLHRSIVTVDTEGNAWREIDLPNELPSSSDDVVSIGQSQGRLYAWQIDICQLHIWVLEDYRAGKWILKHSVGILELFGGHCRKDEDSYKMFAVHPDRNVIFLTDGEKMTLSYDLDNREVNVICTEAMYGLPYIPCFAELPTVRH